VSFASRQQQKEGAAGTDRMAVDGPAMTTEKAVAMNVSSESSETDREMSSSNGSGSDSSGRERSTMCSSDSSSSTGSSSSDPVDTSSFHHSSGGGINSLRQCAQQGGTHITKKDAVSRKNQVRKDPLVRGRAPRAPQLIVWGSSCVQVCLRRSNGSPMWCTMRATPFVRPASMQEYDEKEEASDGDEERSVQSASFDVGSSVIQPEVILSFRPVERESDAFKAVSCPPATCLAVGGRSKAIASLLLVSQMGQDKDRKHKASSLSSGKSGAQAKQPQQQSSSSSSSSSSSQSQSQGQAPPVSPAPAVARAPLIEPKCEVQETGVAVNANGAAKPPATQADPPTAPNGFNDHRAIELEAAKSLVRIMNSSQS
jgi:hypothetical protein